MSGVLNALLGIPGFIVALVNTTVADGGLGGEAGYELQNDGDIIESTTDGGSVDTGDWITPKGASGIGAFSVRATLNSGTLSSGTTGSWLSLSTTRIWVVGPGGAANLTIEISSDGGATVLTSATVVLAGS